MTKSTPITSLSKLPVSSQAITLGLCPVRAGHCRCHGDGKLAFALPWITITALGVFSTAGQPGSAFVFHGIIPGLMAGASGLLLYKATKMVLNFLRRNRLSANQRPNSQVVARLKQIEGPRKNIVLGA